MFFKKTTKEELYAAKQEVKKADSRYYSSMSSAPSSANDQVDHEIERAKATKEMVKVDQKYRRLMSKYKSQNGLN